MSILDSDSATSAIRVSVDEVKVSDRFRQDLGDLSDLKASIDDLGLLHPVVVTADLELVAGQRRLEAMRQLGAIEVDARVVEGLDDAAALLVAERDENTCRKAMTASELYALGKSLEEMERPKRAAATTANLPTTPKGSAEPVGRAYEVVAPAVDMSPAQWKRLKHIGERAEEGDPVATETMEAINKGTETISGGYQAVRDKSTGDLGNVGDKRSVPRKKGPTKQLQQLASKVKDLGNLVRMIDLEGLTKDEADSIAADLAEGLSALNSLKNQLRKVTP